MEHLPDNDRQSLPSMGTRVCPSCGGVLAEEVFGYSPRDRWFRVFGVVLCAGVGVAAVLLVVTACVESSEWGAIGVALAVFGLFPFVAAAMVFNILVFLATRYRIGADCLEVETPVSREHVPLADVVSVEVGRYSCGELHSLRLELRNGGEILIGDARSYFRALQNVETLDRLLMASLKSHGVQVSEEGFRLWRRGVGSHAPAFLRGVIARRGHRLALLRRLLP